MSERRYRCRLAVNATESLIVKKCSPEQEGAARMVKKGLTLPLQDSLALRAQHRLEFVTRLRHPRDLTGGFTRIRPAATQPFSHCLTQALRGYLHSLAKRQPSTRLVEPLFSPHLEAPTLITHADTSGRSS